VGVGDPVTIAIPFHRGRDYLRVAIESVLAQESPDWKLLLVDDSGGDDDAGEVAAAYDDARLVVHRNPANLGMVASWNRCLELAESDLVTLLHADDRLEPGYVALMTRLALLHRDAAAFFCGARIIDAEGRARFSFADSIKRVFVPGGDEAIMLSGRAAVRSLMRGNFIMCPTLCYRKSALAGERFSPDWKQVQDLEFTTRLLMDGRKLVGVREEAYAYRRHAQAATSLQNDNLLRFEEEFRLFECVADRADALGWDEVARVSRRKAIVRLHLAYRAAADVLQLRPGRALARLRLLLQR
jgi:glycosyltransferase involved in cell wall biosynthesis